MTSLPNAAFGLDPLTGPIISAHEAGGVDVAIERSLDHNLDHNEDQQFLLRAFRSFSQAAQSLERSHHVLHAEVERLRRELEKSNVELAESLDENRRMREYLNCILEGLPCGVLVIAQDGSLSQANPEAIRQLHIRRTSVPNCTRTPLSSLDETIQIALERARREHTEQEFQAPATGLSPLWISVRHAPLPNGESVYILRDVSERKAIEAAQERFRREKALAEMSTVLAHEIRNPLASLELFAGLLAESELDSASKNSVEHIQAGLRTLGATVNNVLQFHSLPETKMSPVDLGRLLNWAQDFFSPLAHQSGVVFSLQNRAENVFVMADRHRLEQVLFNVLLNALHAMPEGGWVELAGRPDTSMQSAILSVSDTGKGVTAEQLPRLFEPGFTTRSESPGLGLTVCRKIVEQFGGTISAATRKEAGAVFTITLPLVETYREASI